MKAISALYRFFASYALSCVLFFFLLLLTLLGTLEQVDVGLYETQKKYFESLFVVHYFFGKLPLLLPGVRLLLILLFVNMTLGALFRLPRRWNRAGVYLAHIGIIVLLLGALLTYRYSTNGYLKLYEGERSNVFESYTEWEITVALPDGKGENIIPTEGLRAGATKTFTNANWPFDVTLSGYEINAAPQPASAQAAGAKVVDGFYLGPQKPAVEGEQNLPGAYLTLTPKAGGSPIEAILWGGANGPYAATVDGKAYAFDLHRSRWLLPFTIALDKFTRELHPRTNMPKVFMSDVTKIEGDSSQQIKISMNEPLRHKGYTLYQSGWGPQNAGPNARLFSNFSVVKSAQLGPISSDQFPLYATVIITLGLLVHFLIKLYIHLKTEGPNAS